MKALLGAFNQEKALVGTISVIVKLQTLRRFVSSSIADCSIIPGPENICREAAPSVGSLQKCLEITLLSQLLATVSGQAMPDIAGR